MNLCISTFFSHLYMNRNKVKRCEKVNNNKVKKLCKEGLYQLFHENTNWLFSIM